MILRSAFCIAPFVLATANLASIAQQPASAGGMGSVTGHVTCGDTQRPARFANVVLFGVPAQVTAQAKPDPDADSTAMLTAMADALKTIGKTNMVQTQTGTDGSFIATDVAPGDYYVFGAASGYVSPLNQVLAIYNDGADMKKPLPGVPVVHVSAEHTASMDVTLNRGAAASGVVSWDDGSPVTGAVMTIVSTKSETKPPAQFGMLAMASMLSALAVTDDLGHFRISGLAPGDYLIQATIQSGQQSGIGSSMNLSKMMANKPLVIFAPSAFHKADAKPVTLHGAEDLRDQALTLNLGGVHSVSGRITSAEDHHGINSATVRLQDTHDKDFTRTGPVDAAGNYVVTFLPPGTYTLKVSNAEDTEPAKKDKDKQKMFAEDKTIRSYQPGTSNVIVTDGDVTGQNLELIVDKNPQKEPDMEQLMKDMKN